MNRSRPSSPTLIIALVLAAVAALTFSPVLSHDFIRYDDRLYVTENPHVMTGLTWGNILWAFVSGYASNWHPLTWLSHMVDVQLFGLEPTGHHLTNLLLHAANSALLFLLLHSLTGGLWRSAAVAALFALHPLHVESVAWVAERKDVLSTFFFILTIWAYAAYARSTEPAAGRARRKAYILALLFLALGLMSKPMLVTVPAILLLLDFWPLRRLQRDRIAALLLEKVPFCFLSLASCAITYLVQGKAHAIILKFPFSVRLENAVVSYWKYLAKTIWPADLAIFYPHPDTRYPLSEQWPLYLVILAGVLLLGVCVAVTVSRRRVPWLFTGWFWYLITLLPVIGLIQVGGQAMADRYTYIPLIGVFIAAAWAFPDRLALSTGYRRGLATGTALLLAACATASVMQLRHWRNNLTLFQHALAVTRNNSLAETMIGIELGERGKLDEAIERFRAGIRASPSNAEAYFGLGFVYELQGRDQDALEQYALALERRPWDPAINDRTGEVLWHLGRRDLALQHYRRAIQTNPDYFQAQLHLGVSLAQLGELPTAIEHLRRAVALRPNSREALLRLAEALMNSNKMGEAESRFRQLVELDPTNVESRINLGSVLWARGAWSEAMLQFAEAARLDPKSAIARYNLGTIMMTLQRPIDAAHQFEEAIQLQTNYTDAITGLGRALAAQGQPEQALARYQESLRIKPDAFTLYHMALAQVALKQPAAALRTLREALTARPDWPPVLAELAWLLSTSTDSSLRDGQAALQYAKKACELTNNSHAPSLAALATAYAENGDFAQALSEGEKAADVANKTQDTEWQQKLERVLAKLREHQPYRE